MSVRTLRAGGRIAKLMITPLFVQRPDERVLRARLRLEDRLTMGRRGELILFQFEESGRKWRETDLPDNKSGHSWR